VHETYISRILERKRERRERGIGDPGEGVRRVLLAPDVAR